LPRRVKRGGGGHAMLAHDRDPPRPHSALNRRSALPRAETETVFSHASETNADQVPLSPWPPRRGWYWAVVWGLWLLLLLSIPVTSAPQVAALLGENAVNPLALIPLAVLTVVWFIPYIAQGGRLPAISWPFMAFVALAIVSALAATALPIYPFKGEDMLAREVRALVTVLISLGFFWSAAVLPQGDEEMGTSLRALDVGGIVMLAWSSVQAWVFLSGQSHVPLWLTNLHHLLSIRDPLVDRVTGLAFEPSWLGDQLVVLYLPLWLASVICRWSSFSKSRRRLSFELLLIVWGIAILFLTKSRISLLSLLLVGFVLYVIGSWRAAGTLSRRLARSVQVLGSNRSRRTLHLAFEAVALSVLLAGAMASALVAGKVDRRMAHLLTLPDLLTEIRHFYPNDVPYEVANRLAFAERVVYWADGFRVFEQYPILGVGLGNAGFFFEQSLPAYGYSLTEIRNVLMAADAGFPNPKNLWVRLLAETGVGGFSAFVIWLGLLALAAWNTWKKASPVRRMIGLAALLALLAQVGEGFSLDSFALPQLWIMLGLVTAAVWRRD
jgi:O-antigen ligase